MTNDSPDYTALAIEPHDPGGVRRSKVATHRYLRQFKAASRLKTLLTLTGLHGKRCWYCGQPFDTFKEVEIDHIVPVSRGGDTIPPNLALACIPCNRAKGNLTLEDFLHWLQRPKKPLPHIYERAKKTELTWRQYGDQLNSGLRK